MVGETRGAPAAAGANAVACQGGAALKTW